jgi:hypothetical protein
VQGTLGSGSRDHDWNVSGVNPAIANAWEEINHGYNWRWEAHASLDLVGLFNEIKTLIGYVKTVIDIVGPVLG